MRINTNVASLQAQEASRATNNALSSSLEKLGTGHQINKASDDGSGLAIADKLRTQASSIGQSISNGNSAIALTQIADKAMEEQSNILDMVKTKLVQAATATTNDEGRHNIAKDVNKLLEQLNNIAETTNYNGTYLLQKSDTSASGAGELVFQLGENDGDDISLSSGTIQSNTTGLASLAGVKSIVNTEASASTSASFGTGLTQSIASSMLSDIDDSLTELNDMRSDYGSMQVQIESSVRNMETSYTNLKAAESVIRDVDYAKESAEFNKQNIIAQAGSYAISQANAMQQNVSRLLQ